MIILGIDPGSHRTGYGFVQAEGNRMGLIEAGTIQTPAKAPLPQRLRVIYDALIALVETNEPDVAAVEDVFIARNARSSLILGQARGAALIAVSVNDIPVAEYAPREVKMALTGNGAADKEQVRFMVQRLLGLAKAPASMDASDALGVAICHAMRRSTPAALREAKGRGL